MITDQVKLLKNLAKEIRNEEQSKTKVLASLQSAKIFDTNGNFTKNFSNLSRVVFSSSL
jgi:hypothetical protein